MTEIEYQCFTCKYRHECSGWVKYSRERANKEGIACQQYERAGLDQV